MYKDPSIKTESKVINNQEIYLPSLRWYAAISSFSTLFKTNREIFSFFFFEVASKNPALSNNFRIYFKFPAFFNVWNNEKLHGAKSGM